MVFNKKVVGIFSREDESLYQWLVNLLLLMSVVRDVRQSNISNNFINFQQEAVKCNFAILYHSKRRGRVNVTDVTDSLYDNELRYLNETHGKKSVLVVIDDLEDSSDDVKMEILNSQQSIAQLAEELFIFSTREKDSLSDVMAKGYQRESDLKDKLSHMERIIGGKTSVQPKFPEMTGQVNWGRAEGNFRPSQEFGRFSRLQQQFSPKWVIILGITLVIVLLIIVLPIILHQ